MINKIQIQPYSDNVPFKRQNYAIGQHKNKLYIFGGQIEAYILGDLWEWDTISLNWKINIVNIIPRSHSFIVWQNDQLIILAG